MTTTASATGTAYEVVIGLEVHVQLKTRSKMFCSCDRDYFDAPPNTHVCPICMGMPGVLPVINQQAVAYTILGGLAMGCTIPHESKFDRKNYPYPDLMKGYQISQYDQPFCVGGQLRIDVDGTQRDVQLERIHLEEDTARLLHRGDYSLMDVNRAGVPLMELVSRPDMHSSAEAGAFLRKLRQTMRYLEISDADMEKGSFRCDANISLRPFGQEELGSKVEVKNMNSFRAVQRAIETEIVRQSRLLDEGVRIEQETRGYIDATGETQSQRSKEQASDYRYFPEPDLPPLVITEQIVEEIRALLPELPDARIERYQREFELTHEEARVLSETRARGDAFEEAVRASGGGDARTIARWFIGDVARLLNAAGGDAELFDTKLTPAHVAELVGLLEAGTITSSTAKDVLDATFESGQSPAAIVEERGLTQVEDDGELDAAAAKAIEANPKAVDDYRGGKDSAIQFLVGQVMRETRGRADANAAAETLGGLLDALD